MNQVTQSLIKLLVRDAFVRGIYTTISISVKIKA